MGRGGKRNTGNPRGRPRRVTDEQIAEIRKSKLPAGILAYKMKLDESYIRKVRKGERR